MANTAESPPITPGRAAVKIQSATAESGEKSSVVLVKKIQSFTGGRKPKTTEFSEEENGEDWRFEIKRKQRDAGRKNVGSTAKADWYYWVIRIRKSDGFIVYYGTLDILDAANPERLHKYWKRSKERKNGKTIRG